VIRITGTGKGYYIPFDNEISFNYLKQTYCLAEINNNRIVVNKIMVPSPFTDDEPKIAKCYQFQRFINEKSVATDEVYLATEEGVILDTDYRHMQLFRESTLAGLITQTKTTIGRLGRPNNIIEGINKNRRA
jgi:hypothetical protein